MGKEHMCRKTMVYVRTRFGCFIRMVIDKTAATTEAVPRPKSKTAFEVMMKASREQGQQEWMFPAYAGTGSTQHCSNNNTVVKYYYSTRLKSGVMKTMLPLVCWKWNCGEEETLPIPAEKTAYQTINPVCQGRSGMSKKRDYFNAHHSQDRERLRAQVVSRRHIVRESAGYLPRACRRPAKEADAHPTPGAGRGYIPDGHRGPKLYALTPVSQLHVRRVVPLTLHRSW
ncbi:hypothetical protein Bbelb_319830 [Branchiostoma belcheri]|nr:hypothetical protein Bbelb_319830 [Branchiostoma belcheri]